jgi:hypothetical protein
LAYANNTLNSRGIGRSRRRAGGRADRCGNGNSANSAAPANTEVGILLPDTASSPRWVLADPTELKSSARRASSCATSTTSTTARPPSSRRHRPFPDDFTYVLALQEASVLAMADAYAQVTGKPALVNVHTAAGTGNAMGSLIAAYDAHTPLIVTAGQQHRDMVITEPYPANRDATTLPKPWVKWAYQTASAEEVPAAFMRAYATALQPPAGPVFLTIPLDDWAKPALGPAVVRQVSQRVAPDVAGLARFAERINASTRPALVFGPQGQVSKGWHGPYPTSSPTAAPLIVARFTKAQCQPRRGAIGRTRPMP